jgi:hypothetical protein
VTGLADRAVVATQGPASRYPAGAAGVLGGNWHRLHTLPATGLYPHQWSWDSAFIAIGTRHLSPRRAQQELESLFGAQWSDGRLPQIVFDPARDDDYSPGAAFWRSERIPGSPQVPTAGLVQPPNHAWAALLVHRSDPRESDRRGFLRRAYPHLVAWHGYLAGRRNRGGTGLACVLHPWESGMDNAPAWDEVLAGVTRTRPADARTRPVAHIPRPDLLHAMPHERPTTAEYENYMYLAGRYRDHRCDDADAGYPFVVEDPAFNALWAMSELALARIAEHLGQPAEVHRERARALTTALAELFDQDLGVYVPRDVRTGACLRYAGISGVLPLMLPDNPLAATLLETLRGPRFGLGQVIMVPSFDLTAPEYDGARYWRGPSWFNTAWLIVQGLRQAGAHREADALAAQVIQYAVAGDYPEYVDPVTGAAHGTRLFSWTAALALDLAVARDPMAGLP